MGETKISNEKRETLFEALGWLNGFLEGQDYVAGNNLTLADLSTLTTISSFVVRRIIVFEKVVLSKSFIYYRILAEI